MNTAFYLSRSHDPCFNLAVEEHLLSICDRPTLYLWQNDNCVVIGRHQNPWTECDLAALEAGGGKLVRRLSGGGAVYHDLGNLNFTFLMPTGIYDQTRQNTVLLRAVQSVGIDASFTGRNDLTADGRKFSGHAFCQRKSAAFHHGTLMVDSDLERMTSVLSPDAEKLRSKAIASVRSRVVNLRELAPSLTIETLSNAVLASFCAEYGPADAFTTDELPAAAITPLREKYASWDWRFGEAPRFEAELKKRFSWGGVSVYLELRDACIVNARVYSDAMDPTLPERLSSALQGLSYRPQAIADALRPVNPDVADWLAAAL